MKELNLWIFNHYAVSPDLPGGTRHFDLGKELVNQGHQVTIFASSFQHHQHREMKLAPGEKWRIEKINGIKFVWIRTFPYRQNDWRRVLNMLSYMYRARSLGRRLPTLVSGIKKPDVVIGSSVHLLAVLAAYWVAKHCKARFIMEIRDLWPQTIIDMGELSERSPVTRLLRALEKFLYRRAERIITLLPLVQKYLTSYGVTPEKIVWIPNGVDIARFDRMMTEESHHEGFPLMYLGAHGQANALHVILNAAKIVRAQHHQNIRFILVGDGPQKPILIALAEKLELENVAFCDPVEKDEVPRTLQIADAFLFNLERAEVFQYGISSNKLFDYMAAGKPVIFSAEAPNNPVQEARCGFTVPPQDPQALAETILRLSQMSEEEREAMGKRGREYVEKHHSIPVLAERLIQCIESTQ